MSIRARYIPMITRSSIYLFLGLLLCLSSATAWAQTGTPAATAVAPSTTIAGCLVFAADSTWNQDVSALPLYPNSVAIIARISSGGDKFLHPDFGSNPDYGIPYSIVDGTQAKVPINFVEYGDESDPGPYPVPLNAPIEGGNDHHVLVVEKDHCILYELYHAEQVGNGWNAGSGAVFDLKSNALRPDDWTSTDAAGLPIFPGLAKVDGGQSGEITHALRFTLEGTGPGFIHPPTHQVSDDDSPDLPLMGMRLRLKASFDTNKFTGPSEVLLEGLKRYGMIVAVIGLNGVTPGAPDNGCIGRE